MYLKSRYFLEKICALALIILLLPIWIIISILLYITIGSVIFKQYRIGYDNKVFTIYKFKTILNDNVTDEEHMTRFGKFLRYSSLDEIPQLYNIIKGEMSFIGPRPLVATYLPAYSSEELSRHSILPGITGYAQVNGRNSISWKEKFKLDVYYVNHLSLLLDLNIIARTFVIAFNYGAVSLDMPTFSGDSLFFIGDNQTIKKYLQEIGFKIIFDFSGIIDISKVIEHKDKFDYLVITDSSKLDEIKYDLIKNNIKVLDYSIYL